MDDLLKSEPGGRSKLYKGVQDDKVNADTETFTWEWIKKATKIQKKARFKDHLSRGHFGPWEEIGSKAYRLVEGHRAICRFNNGRHKQQKTVVVTKQQYDDMQAGRPVSNVIVMVRGRPQLKPVSIKRYNHSDFIAVKRYSPDQAHVKALARVEKDISDKIVPWHDLDRGSEEFQNKSQIRVQMFEDLMLAEMVLMAKETASAEDIRAAADLPASILNLIDYKLSATQAEYYIGRFVAAVEMIPGLMKNPFMAFRMHQIILEELQVEHYRDLQRLYGDDINKQVQEALAASLARLHRLTPGGLMKSNPPGNNGGGNPRPAVPGVDNPDTDPFGDGF